ncbi:hypothetical protein BBJ28_00025134, partial [Nothophytophthora sp. Chile5]
MLSCKTFLKLFAVAVALSQYKAAAGHATDCEMIYDDATPSPTVTAVKDTSSIDRSISITDVPATSYPVSNPTNVAKASDTRQQDTTGGDDTTDNDQYDSDSTNGSATSSGVDGGVSGKAGISAGGDVSGSIGGGVDGGLDGGAGISAGGDISGSIGGGVDG